MHVEGKKIPVAFKAEKNTEKKEEEGEKE